MLKMLSKLSGDQVEQKQSTDRDLDLFAALEAIDHEAEAILNGQIRLQDQLHHDKGAAHGAVELIDSILARSKTSLRFNSELVGTARIYERKYERKGDQALAAVLYSYAQIALTYPYTVNRLHWLDSGAGPGPEDYADFRVRQLPGLLIAAAGWAADRNLSTEQRRVTATKNNWSQLLGPWQ